MLANFFEGAGTAIVESVAELEDFLFAVGESGKHTLQALLEEGVGGCFARGFGRFVFLLGMFLVVTYLVAPLLVADFPLL